MWLCQAVRIRPSGVTRPPLAFTDDIFFFLIPNHFATRSQLTHERVAQQKHAYGRLCHFPAS